jgi:hypothetical protein
MRDLSWRLERDIDRIFPMDDAESAWLMRLKARCLCEAGVISPTLRAEIDRRAIWFAHAVRPPAWATRGNHRSVVRPPA